MRNQQAGTANNSCQYRTVNIAVPPPQTAHFIFQDGRLSEVNRQTSNWQTSAAPHQPVSSQHPSGGKNISYMKMFYNNNRSSTNIQSGNPCLPATGFQVATEQNFNQNSAQNSKHQAPPNVMAPCSKQDMMTHWNQSGTAHGKRSIWPQDGNIVFHHQHHSVQKKLYQDVIGKQIKPYPAPVTRATLLPRCTSSLVSPTAHSRQTAHNQDHRQNVTQHGFCHPILPTSYSTAVTQSFINNTITTNSSLGGQIWPSSSMSQKMQQYSAPLNSLHNSGRKATSSVNSNSNSCQYETVSFLQQTNERPFAPAADVQQQPLGNTAAQIIARIAENLRKSYPGNSDSRHPVHTTSPYKGKQFVGEVRVMDFNQTMQPVKSTVAESSNSNATQLLPIHSGQSLPNTTQVATTRAQHSVNASPQQSHVADVFYDITTTDGSGNGSKAGGALFPKNSSVSEGNLDGSLNDASQLVLMSESASAQRTETQTNCEILEVLEILSNMTVPISQNGPMDKTEMPVDPEACVFDLSSVPTTSWTISTLLKLVQDGENAQMELEDFTNFDSAHKVLSMFWEGQGKNLLCKLKGGWYKDFITGIKEYCSKHLTTDCVVLSQVKQSSEKQLKSYHVLKDSEVYSEMPYRSSWLNVNEQVDDIDKEFGFQQSFMHRLHTCESLSLPDQVGTVDSIPAQSEVPNKVLSQTELEPVDPDEGKQASTAEALSTQTSSPIGTESDESSDPCYSFKIQVLPPEQAKMIFEQIQSKIPQSMDVDSEPETVTKSSVEDEFPDSELENEIISSLEHICCIDRLREKFVGPSLSKCQCKKEQSDKDCTDRVLEKEETTVPTNDKLCVVRSDSKFHSPIKGQDEVKVGKNIDNPVLTCSWPDLYSDLSQSESDKKPDSYSDKEIKNISQISINNSLSSVILISNTEDDLPTRESEIPSQIPSFGNPLSDPEDDCVRDQLKSAGSSRSRSLLNSKKEIQKVYSSESASHMSDPEEDCVQAQLTSTDVAESSLETEIQTEISATGALPKTFSLSREHETVKRKRKTLSSNPQIFPTLKKLRKCKPSANLDAQPVFKGIKCKKGFVDAADSESSASKVRTAELVLFGSAHQGKCILPGNRKRHVSSTESSSNAVQRPPDVLYVTLNPSRRKSSVPTSEYSVKHYIYEKWRRSYPPTKIRIRGKLTTKKCIFASLSVVNLKKVETAAPTNTKEVPGAPEGRNGNTKRCLSLSRRRALSNRLKLGEEKKMTHAVTLDRSRALIPLKENSVLRFSVLPNTFNLVVGSGGRKETTDPVSDNADLVERKDNSYSNTICRQRDTWFPSPEKKYCPLRSPSVPKTSILFQEFQKKYMERTQPSQAK
ncbi:uncharacterized protein [Trachinotus anak]|uniref:uncharacterized protein n=1 Tax=Trachinotus anak TaxID=443729 RepID=UPI0039F16B30